MRKLRLPEVLIGSLLTIALFGAISTVFPHRNASQEAQSNASGKGSDADLTGSTWLTKDASGFFTFVAASVAFGQAAFFLYQLVLMRRSLIDASRAANAAERAAEATSSALELTRGTTASQLRAYVFAQNVEFFWLADKATDTVMKWMFFPVWKNAGATPTRRMVSNVNRWVGMDAGPLPADFEFPDYGQANRNMIGPGAIMHGEQVELTVEQLQKIRDGTGHAYLWGWAEYSDVFAGTTRHRSEFCFEIKVTGNPSFKETRFTFAMHGPFNGSDEDCYRKPST